MPSIAKSAQRGGSTYEEPSTSSQHIIELTPSGHGTRKTYEPLTSSKHTHSRSAHEGAGKNNVTWTYYYIF